MPVWIEAASRRISAQWARISADVDAPGDQRLQRGSRRLAETVEPAVLEIGDARREAEAEQGAKREDMVGDPAAIGVVAAGSRCPPLRWWSSAVEHMQGFAGGRRDHLGVERRDSGRKGGCRT